MLNVVNPWGPFHVSVVFITKLLSCNRFAITSVPEAVARAAPSVSPNKITVMEFSVDTPGWLWQALATIFAELWIGKPNSLNTGDGCICLEPGEKSRGKSDLNHENVERLRNSNR